MSDYNVADRLRTLVVEYSGIDPDRITDEAHLFDDLGIDSLEKVELVMAAEEEFAVEISDDRATKVQTFGDIVRLVEQLIA